MDGRLSVRNNDGRFAGDHHQGRSHQFKKKNKKSFSIEVDNAVAVVLDEDAHLIVIDSIIIVNVLCIVMFLWQRLITVY